MSNKPQSYDDLDEEMRGLENQLEEVISDYYDVARNKANAEADWKIHKGRVLIKIASSGDRMSEDTREAKALQTVDPSSRLSGEDLYRTYLLAAADEKAVDKHTYAIQTRLSVAQTRAKSLRSATGLDH